MKPRQVEEQARRDFETRRKVEMAVEAIHAVTASRSNNRTWGKFVVVFDFQDGYVKEVKFKDHSTFVDRRVADKKEDDDPKMG
jgi:hypothetical protein